MTFCLTKPLSSKDNEVRAEPWLTLILKHLCVAHKQAMAIKKVLLGWGNMFSTIWLLLLGLGKFLLAIGGEETQSHGGARLG